MENIQITQTDVSFNDPYKPILENSLNGSATDSFSIEVSGQGQLTGLSYTIPAHAQGSIKAKLQTSAITSEDVKALNELALGMLSASYKEEITEFEKTSASSNLSIWGWFFGGGATSSGSIKLN